MDFFGITKLFIIERLLACNEEKGQMDLLMVAIPVAGIN